MSHDRDEFEAKLAIEFPNLFRNMHGDMRVTCMAWGIDTGPGWYQIIYDLSAKLEQIILTLPESVRHDVHADQVKEKFGGLRFYMSLWNAEIQAAIKEAEAKCWKTCESCGQPGGLCGQSPEWLYVACKAHAKDQHKFIFNETGDYIGYPEEP